MGYDEVLTGFDVYRVYRVGLHAYGSIYLSIYLFIYQYVYHISLSVCLFIPTYSRIYLSLNPGCRRGTTDDLATSCLHPCLTSTALCDSGKAQSCPVHSLASSRRFLWFSRLLGPLTVPLQGALGQAG